MILVCAGVVSLGLGSWLVAAKVPSANSPRGYDHEAASEFLFEQRPFSFQCADRPQLLPPGEHSWLSSSGQAPYARTRLETLNIPLAEEPALTIASEPTSFIRIAGVSRDDWELQFCAIGAGDSEPEARQFLDDVSMSRTGSLISVNASHPAGRKGGRGDLIAQVPREAPLTVHTVGAVELRNLSGPVRVSAVGGRATILNTTGTVDADGQIVDYAGAHGHVMLNSYSEIDLKLTGPRFVGGLSAYAQSEVRVLVPRGFESQIEVMVENKRDLVCRADICSRMKWDNHSGAPVFRKYADSSEAAPDHVFLRSDHSTVVIDNWYPGPFQGLQP
ncbi:MAG: hypothetical protein ABSB60_05320 [Terracidiphilus sp.]|jgi:hypothetical protein